LKNTPGQWEAVKHEGNPGTYWTIVATTAGCSRIVLDSVAAAAPELLKVCKDIHNATDWLFASLIIADRGFMPSQSPAWPAMTAVYEIIKRLDPEHFSGARKEGQKP
jgi:hypothetical protein